jgi:hypothetical protein
MPIVRSLVDSFSGASTSSRASLASLADLREFSNGAGEEEENEENEEVATPHRVDPSLTKKCVNALCLFKAAAVSTVVICLMMLVILVGFFVETAPCWGELQVHAMLPPCRVSYLVRIIVVFVMLVAFFTVTCIGQKTYRDAKLKRTVRVSEPVSAFALGIVVITTFVVMFPWLPAPLIPFGPLVLGYVYTMKRRDARMRMLVFVIVIPLFSVTAVVFAIIALVAKQSMPSNVNLPLNATVSDERFAPFAYDPWSYTGHSFPYDSIHAASVMAALVLGWITAVSVRFVSSYKSGVLFHPGCTKCHYCLCSKKKTDKWIDQPKSYEELVRTENLETFDILLDSETRYQASRMTRIFSRSNWTHAATIVKDPSDQVKRAYGCMDVEETGITNMERYFVFEAVRPVVRLTPLKKWMRLKADQGKDRRISAFVKLRFTRTGADADLVNEWMLEKKGTRFVTDPNRMRDANYQLNRDWNEDPKLRDSNDDGSMFCSQLVASGLQKINLLDRIRPSANYTPHDLSNEETTTTPFLRRGAAFSRERVRIWENKDGGHGASM